MDAADISDVEGQGGKPTVFLSYSRDDIDFVERLHAVLEAKDIDAHLDRHDIEKGEDWWVRLQQLIAASDTIVFVLSPSSVSSDVCRREVEYAVSLNKRLIPIVMRDLGDIRPPEDLQRLNYIFFMPNERAGATGDFDTASDDLLGAIKTDIEWIREHTRFGRLALRWQDLTETKAVLLRGSEIDLAETWLGSRPADAPQPTALIQQFITESRRAAIRGLRQRLGIALAVTAVSILLTIFAFAQWNRAENEARTALSRQLASQSATMQATDFGGALRVAASAYEIEDNRETRGALLAATAGNPHTIAMLGTDGDITQIAASPTASVIAMGQNDGRVRLWDVTSRTWADVVDTGLEGQISAITFGRDPAHLAVADATGQRSVILGSERRMTLPRVDAGWITFGFAFSPDSTLLAEASREPGGYGEVLRLWDIASNQPQLLGTIPSDDLNHIEHLSFPSDDLLHFVDLADLRSVSLQTGQITYVASHGRGARPGPSAYDGFGVLGVSSGFDTGGFFVFNAVTDEDIGEGTVAAAPIDAIAISQDNTRIAIAQERHLWVFDELGMLQQSFDAGLSKVEDLIFANDANVLVALTPSRQAHVFDLSSSHRLAREIAPYAEVPSVIQEVMDAAFSPDGRYLGWIGRSDVDDIWNFSTFDLTDNTQQSYSLEYDPLFEIAFLTDATALVSGASGTELAVDLAAGSIVQDVSCGGVFVSAIWTAREGQPLLFDRCTANGLETQDFTGQAPTRDGATVQSSSLSADGVHLAILTLDNMLQLVNFASESETSLDISELSSDGAQNAGATVRLSPDGSAIALGFYNDVLWLFQTDELYSAGRFGSGASDQIASWVELTFSPSGAYLAVERGNGRFGLWDISQTKFLAEFESDANVPARHLVFDPEDRYIAEARPGGGMVLWTIDPERWLDEACLLAGRPLSEQERRALVQGSKYAEELTACGGQ